MTVRGIPSSLLKIGAPALSHLQIYRCICFWKQASSQSTTFAFDSNMTFHPLSDNLSKCEVDAILLLLEVEGMLTEEEIAALVGDAEEMTMDLYTKKNHNLQEASGSMHALQVDDFSYIGSLKYESSDTESDGDDDQFDRMEVARDDEVFDRPNSEPPQLRVSFLSENDVVFGRGGHCTHSIGHQRYLQERNRLCTEYQNVTGNAIKRQIQTQLIQFVLDQGGRFLEKIKQRNAHVGIIQGWLVVPNGPQLYKKVAQALREGEPKA